MTKTMRRKKLHICLLIGLFLVMVLGAGIHTILNKTSIDLKVNGEEKLTWESGTVYTDAGATVTCRGLLKNKHPEILTLGEVDWATPGTYTIKYAVKQGIFHDSASRVVTVQDTLPPTLELLGEKEIAFCEPIGHFSEEGWLAEDINDGDMSEKVEITGEVNDAVPGTYTLTYTVTDAAGNSASDTRTVTVLPLQQMGEPVNTGEKIVYLTFDDGPGPYTRELLDILARYNVKATFFVVNTKYRDLIADEAAEGHTVAIHSATHDYRKIYASSTAYFNDLQTMQDVIVEKTGKPAELVRFPGGSSNTVSKFNRGIMTRLAAELQEKGYQYVDWNVVSGDAGDTTETEVVKANVIAGMQKKNQAVILQHDIKKFSVDAVEDIIRWGLMNGYTFLPLDTSSPTVHQRINN